MNVNVFLEGFYRTASSSMVANLYDLGISSDETATDTITVNLWHADSLSNEAPSYSVKAILHTDGTATAVFPGGSLGNNYYIAIKHRNSIETWSASAVTISQVNSYNFTTSLSAAYDDGVNPPKKSGLR